MILGIDERQDIRDALLAMSRIPGDVTYLNITLGKLLTEFDKALELLEDCVKDGGDNYRHVEVELFVKKHGGEWI